MHIAEQQQRGNHQQRHRDHDHAQHAAESGHFLLQRRFLLLRAAEQVGDLAHFSAHAGGRDQCQSAAASHRRALEHHVDAIAQRHWFRQRDRLFQHRLAFAGERGFLYAQRVRLQQARIGAHGIAFGQ